MREEPQRIEFQVGGGLWDRLWCRLGGRLRGKAPGELVAVAEGEELKVFLPPRPWWCLRPPWEPGAREGGWLTVPFEAVRGLSDGSDEDAQLRLHYVEGGWRRSARLGAEAEGGTHSLRLAVAAILEQRRLDWRRDREGRAREAGATMRRIEATARFAEGSGGPGFVDHREG